LGASRPTIVKNAFFALPHAVSLGDIGGDSPFAKTTGEVELSDNLFWQVEVPVAAPPRSAAAAVAQAAGNRVADPRFVDAAGCDFELAADSPARAAGIGVADPLSFASPWPQQPEEA